MAAALRMLAARPRSESQLRKRLLRKDWVEAEAVERCIARLKELGYLDDLRYAENFAASRVRNKPVGRSRLKRELAGKEVAKEVIDQALESVFEAAGEEELIDRAIEKRLRIRGNPKDANDRKKLIAYLLRLGFDYDLIVKKLKEVTSDE
jgi:regulatory protein